MLLWGTSTPQVRVLTDIGWLELDDAMCINVSWANNDRVPARNIYEWRHGSMDPLWNGHVPLDNGGRMNESPAEALAALMATYPDLKLANSEWGKSKKVSFTNRSRTHAAACRAADKLARQKLANGDRRMLAYAKRML